MDVGIDLIIVLHQPLNGVGDLQFASPGGRDIVRRLVDVMVEHVNADERQVRGWLLWLFDQPHDAPILVQFGHSVSLWMCYPREDDLAVPVALSELFDEPRDASLDDIVTQEHHETLVAQEISAHLDSVGQSLGLLLVNVGDLGVPATASSDGGFDPFGGVADDDADVGDASVADGLDDAEEHRLVGDGYELLGVGVGQWIETGALAPAENQTFHLANTLPMLRRVERRSKRLPRYGRVLSPAIPWPAGHAPAGCARRKRPAARRPPWCPIQPRRSRR